jgi:hypothetical protein
MEKLIVYSESYTFLRDRIYWQLVSYEILYTLSLFYALFLFREKMGIKEA